MLPSMPLISTPYKEGCRSLDPSEDDAGKEPDKDDGDCRAASDSVPGGTEAMPCAAPGISGCTKRCSPLKHVTPILKKYSCQRKVRGNKTAAGSPEQAVEKPGLRPIAPKPVVVMITSQPLAQNRNDMSITTCSVEQTAVVETTSSPRLAVEQPKNQECEVTAEGRKIVDEQSKPEIVKDNEEDIAALMHSATNVCAAPRARPALSRKKTKQLKDMEAALNVLTDVEDAATKEEKASSFAYAYFMKVKERLEGREDDVYQKFLQTMKEFELSTISVADLYHQVTALLGHHSDLASEFLAFLLPNQALQCGKLVEHLMITKMRDFFRKLEVFFARQPHHMKKIYSSLSMLSNQTNVTIGDVQSTILPLLKGNTFLTHSFMELLPQACPPDSLMTEFEFVQCYDDSESEEEMFEMVEVPDHPDPYGGNNCCCPCHDSTNEKYRTRVLHCIPCGTRFIHGRVFVETGKGLRHAKVIFAGADGKANVERLTAAKVLQRKGRRRRRTCGHIRKNRSPSKQASAVAKVTNSEDNSAENPNVPTTSKILSPTMSRSKTRTTNVSQKARETCASVAIASSSNSTSLPTEKKDSKCSPSKPGRQVATVRLCRVPSTVGSYAIVPSSKSNTKVSVSFAEAKIKSSAKTGEPPSCTTSLSSSTTDRNTSAAVLRPSVDQQKHQQLRQKKSVDGSVCFCSDVSVRNTNACKLQGVETARNVQAGCNVESVGSHKKKRCIGDEASGSHARKVPKHFHDSVVAGKNDIEDCQDAVLHQENLNSSEVPVENVSAGKIVQSTIELDSKSNSENTKENEMEAANSSHNWEENKPEYIEQLVRVISTESKYDVEEHIEKFVLTKDLHKNRNDKLGLSAAVGIKESDLETYLEPIELVAIPDSYHHTSDKEHVEEADVVEGLDLHIAVKKCDRSSLLEVNSIHKLDYSQEVFDKADVMETVADYEMVSMATENSKVSDRDKHIGVTHNFQGEMLIANISKGVSEDFDVMEAIEVDCKQRSDNADLLLTTKNDIDEVGVDEVKVMEMNNECEENAPMNDEHEGLEIAEVMDVGESCKYENAVEKSEEIEVHEMGLEENGDTPEWSMGGSDDNHCEYSRTGMEPMNTDQERETIVCGETAEKGCNDWMKKEVGGDCSWEDNVDICEEKGMIVVNIGQTRGEGTSASVDKEKQCATEDRKPFPWTRDEDKVILETFQMCSNMDSAFVSISDMLPSRSVEEIRTRFKTLINLLQQLTGNTLNQDIKNCT